MLASPSPSLRSLGALRLGFPIAQELGVKVKQRARGKRLGSSSSGQTIMTKMRCKDDHTIHTINNQKGARWRLRGVGKTNGVASDGTFTTVPRACVPARRGAACYCQLPTNTPTSGLGTSSYSSIVWSWGAHGSRVRRNACRGMDPRRSHQAHSAGRWYTTRALVGFLVLLI